MNVTLLACSDTTLCICVFMRVEEKARRREELGECLWEVKLQKKDSGRRWRAEFPTWSFRIKKLLFYSLLTQTSEYQSDV